MDVNHGESPDVRVRFAPSPTGYLHIGGARTVLFNWLFARKVGGRMILRIEDTDRTRHIADSTGRILDDLRWLGLDWDEGPEIGGDFGPYFQSERLDLYEAYLRKLLESGHAYYALETPEQLEALREQAGKEKRGFTYPRPDPLPTIEQGLSARKAGRPVVVRFKMPDQDITIADDILGEVTLRAGQIDDFVIQKADGYPTYHLACVVDDQLMKITHVLRGQEHLNNTPKHVALQRALGFSTPRYAHLPLIFNMDGSKMSKRDKEKAAQQGVTPPEIDVHDFRVAGYLPEALVNFIALLGWSPGGDRERFTIQELTSEFSIERIGKANARFDREKLLSFNTDWAARLPVGRMREALRDYLNIHDLPMRQADDEALARVLELCAGFRTFADVVTKAGFFFVPDDAIQYNPKAVKKVLAKNENAGFRMLEELLPELEALSEWSGAALETFLSDLCDRKGFKLGQVAQPLRVAVSGGMISPTIGETLAMLGRDRTLARIRRCLANAKGLP